jgi:hypothetical protein
MMQYQFCIDGRPAAQLRTLWVNAAHDAVSAGYAIWVSNDEIRLNDTQGATIERYEIGK